MTTQVLMTTEELQTVQAALRNWCALYPGMVDALDQRATDILDGLQAQQPQAEPSDEDIAKLHDSMFPSPYGGHASVIKFSRALLAMRQQPQAAGVPEVRKIDLGFRWDGEAQQHIPSLTVEFEAVPANGPCDAKGWRDRDALAAMLSATPPHPATAPAQGEQA